MCLNDGKTIRPCRGPLPILRHDIAIKISDLLKTKAFLKIIEEVLWNVTCPGDLEP